LCVNRAWNTWRVEASFIATLLPGMFLVRRPCCVIIIIIIIVPLTVFMVPSSVSDGSPCSLDECGLKCRWLL